MRLSDVLSKPLKDDYIQIEGFLPKTKKEQLDKKLICQWEK